MRGPEVEDLTGRKIFPNQTLRIYTKNIFPKLDENYLRIQGVQVFPIDYQNDSLVLSCQKRYRQCLSLQLPYFLARSEKILVK